MNKKRNFSKKALRDFKLIDLAIKSNNQHAFKKLMEVLFISRKELIRLYPALIT